MAETTESVETHEQKSETFIPPKAWPNTFAVSHLECEYGLDFHNVLQMVPMLTAYSGPCTITEKFNDGQGGFCATLEFNDEKIGKIEIKLTRSAGEQSYQVEEFGFDELRYNDPNLVSINPRDLQNGDVVRIRAEKGQIHDYLVLNNDDNIILGYDVQAPEFTGNMMPFLLGQQGKVVSLETFMSIATSSEITQIMVIPAHESPYQMPTLTPEDQPA